MNSDIYVRLKDLPYTIRGLTVSDQEGNYNIYINTRLSYEMQQYTYTHELKHIIKNHLYSNKSISDIEG